MKQELYYIRSAAEFDNQGRFQNDKKGWILIIYYRGTLTKTKAKSVYTTYYKTTECVAWELLRLNLRLIS